MQVKLHVRKVREEKKMSRERLAGRSEVALSHIHRIEKNAANPSLAVMCKLAKTLDVSVCDLFSYE